MKAISTFSKESLTQNQRVMAILPCWDPLSEKPEDKCKSSLPQRVRFSSANCNPRKPKVHINTRPQSTPTLQPEVRNIYKSQRDRSGDGSR